MSKPKIASNINIPDQILLDLLTESEVRMLKNRWQIINLLEEGLSVRKIAERIKVGTDTVVRISRMAEKRNIKKMLSKPQLKNQTPWVFGKAE
ncbi:MAG: Trp family transcriptional regulator [Candidatus Daviesbacteria bacterium]